MIGTAFTAARIKLGLRSRAPQPGDPDPWGKQKASARRAALEKGIADTNAKAEALYRKFVEQHQALMRNQLSYGLALAEVEMVTALKVQERACPAGRRLRSAQSEGLADQLQLSGGLSECEAWRDPEPDDDEPWEQEDWDTTDAVPSLAYLMDPVDGLDDGQLLAGSDLMQLSVDTADERAQSAVQYDPEEERGLDRNALYALVAAVAPGWLNVDAPPPSVCTRFPLCGMLVGDLRELGPLNLRELLPPLLEIGGMPPPALPATSDQVLTWLGSNEGAGYRGLLQNAIWREQARRLLWPELVEWYGMVLALAPGGQFGTKTFQEAEREFDGYKKWYRVAIDPRL